MKKVLLIGNGGREHCIAKKLSQSKTPVQIINFATAINPGIAEICGTKNIHVGDILNLKELRKIAELTKPDWAFLGPDDPIAIGSADVLGTMKIPSFGPTKKNAQLESSKSFTRNLLQKYNIDASPDFLVSTEVNDGNRADFFQKRSGNIVVKADGLLGGKGVIVAGDHFTDFEEAENFAEKSIEKFNRVVLEEKLEGEEFSLISITDGNVALHTPAIQDHKRALEDDKGPNTGGMGTISDEKNRLPFLNTEDIKSAEKITNQTLQALQKETGERYIGCMYGGFIKTKNGIRLIEYNARFGDPEVYNVLPIMKNDLVEVCEKAIAGNLAEVGELKFKSVATVVRYLCPKGYPENPIRDEQIFYTENEASKGEFFYASVGIDEGRMLLKGSRAVAISGVGKNIAEAKARGDELIKSFSGPLFYRSDIGTPELMQKRIDHLKALGI